MNNNNNNNKNMNNINHKENNTKVNNTNENTDNEKSNVDIENEKGETPTNTIKTSPSSSVDNISINTNSPNHSNVNSPNSSNVNSPSVSKSGHQVNINPLFLLKDKLSSSSFSDLLNSKKEKNTKKKRAVIMEVKATEDFSSPDFDKLSFTKGETISVMHKYNISWWEGKIKRGEEKFKGLFPSSKVSSGEDRENTPILSSVHESSPMSLEINNPLQNDRKFSLIKLNEKTTNSSFILKTGWTPRQ
eukprot:TRINITY_DN1674_c0_g3_i2.p1 TRINITY_DN1674_c0_g3~~TRINITY_DN1674_c0_g3_i2.p1  ORF type:complete len:278 (+),score=117.12 TRINITY_DN1674_c0_g3_i2:97-834(+)